MSAIVSTWAVQLGFRKPGDAPLTDIPVVTPAQTWKKRFFLMVLVAETFGLICLSGWEPLAHLRDYAPARIGLAAALWLFLVFPRSYRNAWIGMSPRQRRGENWGDVILFSIENGIFYLILVFILVWH